MAKNMTLISVITLEKKADLTRINYIMGSARTITTVAFEAMTVCGKGAALIEKFLGDDFNELTAQNVDTLDEMETGDRIHFIVEKDGEAKKFMLVCLSTGNSKFLPEFYCPDLYDAR